MYPILLDFGELKITSFGVFLTLAFIVFVLVLMKLAPRRDVNMDFFTKNLFVLFIGAALGTKVLFWLLNYNEIYYNVLSAMEIQKIFALVPILFNAEQFYLMGGIVTFGLIFSFLAKRQEQQILPWLDVLLPSFSIALSIALIGSFLGGFYVGGPTESLFGIDFSSADAKYSIASFLYTIPIHPIQLYSALSTFLIFLVLYEVMRKVKVQGVVGVVGLLLLGIQNIVIEVFRGDDNIFRLFGFTINQYISLLGILLAIYLFMKRVPKIVG